MPSAGDNVSKAADVGVPHPSPHQRDLIEHRLESGMVLGAAGAQGDSLRLLGPGGCWERCGGTDMLVRCGWKREMGRLLWEAGGGSSKCGPVTT